MCDNSILTLTSILGLVLSLPKSKIIPSFSKGNLQSEDQDEENSLPHFSQNKTAAKNSSQKFSRQGKIDKAVRQRVTHVENPVAPIAPQVEVSLQVSTGGIYQEDILPQKEKLYVKTHTIFEILHFFQGFCW